MDFSVEGCRRRPSCARLLIYLDTSTYAHIAKGTQGSERLVEVLGQALDEGTAVCVGSPWLDDEVAMLRFGPRLDLLVKTIRRFTLDVQMKYEETLIDYELSAAAKEFSGETVEVTWEEAFQNDPDDPPLRPFQAEYLNEREGFEHPPLGFEDAKHDRGTSQALAEVHEELREAGLTWEEVAAANLAQQARYLTDPMGDSASQERALRLDAAVTEDWLRGDLDMAAGSSVGRYLRLAHVVHVANSLRERYPAIAADPAGFTASEAVTNLPSVRLTAFLLAALSVDGRRTKPQPSDLHDLRHLGYGLSRCDVVTADKRSCALAQGRELVPSGVILLPAHELETLAEHIQASVDARRRLGQ